MRYILKRATPQSFIDRTNSLTNWNEYHDCCNKQKRALRKYILKYEQNYLCIYCESKISSLNNSSHLEHIRPKSQDKYPELTFEYTNLVVSCNGNCHSTDDSPQSCGHIKDNKYNEDKFLNPTEIENIREYFIYDIDDGNILPSLKNSEKSTYMIDTLNLNDENLSIARKIALENLITRLNRIDISKRKEQIIQILNKENISQVSFLRFRFKDILEV